MTKYYIEDTIRDNPLIIRSREGRLLERFDRTTKKWIEDVELLRIYTGDLPVDAISEEEAMNAIAKIVCIQAHKGQKDKAGKDYYLHPFFVASMCTTEEEKTVAYLHDVVEDTFLTLENLKAYGFNQNIIDAVNAITRKPEQSYDDYIKIVKANPLARIVKINDLIHNSDLTRFVAPTQKDRKRAANYERYIAFLKAPE